MKIKNVLLLFMFAAALIYPQDRQSRDFKKHSKKFEQLEQLKLLEILNLDETTAIKFITRRNKNKENLRSIMNQMDEVFNKLEALVDSDAKSKNYNEQINQVLLLEIKIANEKSNFLKSLKDILSEEQIAKVILFERKFKRDVRDALLERGKKRFKED
ncbi:MAG: hypothetical protein H6613_11830 [Ignavibacteriales bacterium]|nr:hypothetical protein [Ignavibacteriales bacterium]